MLLQSKSIPSRDWHDQIGIYENHDWWGRHSSGALICFRHHLIYNWYQPLNYWNFKGQSCANHWCPYGNFPIMYPQHVHIHIYIYIIHSDSLMSEWSTSNATRNTLHFPAPYGVFLRSDTIAILRRCCGHFWSWISHWPVSTNHAVATMNHDQTLLTLLSHEHCSFSSIMNHYYPFMTINHC